MASGGPRGPSPAGALQLEVGLDGSAIGIGPPPADLADLALVTARFYPSDKYRPPLACPPHPRAASLVVTNLEATEYAEEPCWRHLVMPTLRCVDATSCSMASKMAKMPFAHAAPSQLRHALSRFRRVLYIDDKISFVDAVSLAQLVTQAPPGNQWALLLREHEGTHDGHRGVEAELRAALQQPRYRAREAEIRRFVYGEQADVPRGGLLHNTGLLLWNAASEHVRELSDYWYDATMRTSPECQITFFYAFRRLPDAVVTVPFAQPGVRWRLVDAWEQYARS